MLAIDLFEKWTAKYKRSIDCSNPKGFSQRAHCAGRKKHNENQLTLVDGFRGLLPIAVKHLNLPTIPKIHLNKEQSGTHQASFGGYDSGTDDIHLTISNRHPVDVLRTLAHELVHYRQKLNGELVDDSWKTGSDAENEANAEAGVIMRLFNKQYPEFMNVKPIISEGNNFYLNNKYRNRQKGFVTVDGIHQLADKLGINWDNNPNFMKMTKLVTGKEHLDDLSVKELIKMRNHLLSLHESKEFKTFYHGSHKDLPTGTILTPRDDYENDWSHTDFYPALELHRPKDKLAHKQSVFMVDNDEDIDNAGGPTDYVLTVEPQGRVERHDLNWSTEVSLLIADGYDIKSPEVKRAAEAYWAGIPHSNDSVWEYLTPKAKVVASEMFENFADGKVKGKSRPGRVKKAGASCKGSVTDLRAKARKYGGEKGKMYHWCANMKGGKKK